MRHRGLLWCSRHSKSLVMMQKAHLGLLEAPSGAADAHSEARKARAETAEALAGVVEFLFWCPGGSFRSLGLHLRVGVD